MASETRTLAANLLERPDGRYEIEFDGALIVGLDGREDGLTRDEAQKLLAEIEEYFNSRSSVRMPARG